MKGSIFHIQRFSLFDGPGVRTVVFLKGCPLRCIWCHNPEGWNPRKQILYSEKLCIGCGICAQACAHGCHSLSGNIHIYDRKHCTSCGACARACPGEALRISGAEMDTAEVMEQVLLDQEVYASSGGGVTLSGGEPLYQPKFSKEILKEAKRAGIHTCVETSGAGVQKDLLSLLPYTDLLYYDYKLTDSKAHLFYTGADLQQILENLSAAANTGVPIVLRCPIIPGINMEYTHYIGIARTASEASSIREIHLQPYHSLGEGKAAQLGIKHIYKGKTPADAEMELARETVMSALKQDIPVMIL